MEKVKCTEEKLSKSREYRSSERPERGKVNNFDYIKKLNSAKKVNLTIKEDLKKLNKTLDKIIKTQHSVQGPRYLSPLDEREDEITKKIENTEVMISKYMKEISSLKESQSSTDYSEKVHLNSEVLALQQTLKEIEQENIRLFKGCSHFAANGIRNSEERSLKKELLALKEKQRQLESLIKEDEKIINDFILKGLASRESKSGKSQSKASKEADKSMRCDHEIESLKAKIAELEATKKHEEGIWKLRLQDMKNSLEDKKREVLKLEGELKEKDKNCRIKKLNIKAQQRVSRLILKPNSAENDEIYEIREN